MIDIDKALPSKDEAATQAALCLSKLQDFNHSIIKLKAEYWIFDADVDILLEHCDQNQPVHPPNTGDLAISHATQCWVQQAGSFDGPNLSNDGSQADLEYGYP